MGVSTGQQCDHSHRGFLSHYQMSPGSGGLMGNDGHNGQTPGTDVSDQPQQESLTGKLWAGSGGCGPLIGQY